jgi:nucleotide-binding universal stress UspA family protein
LRAVTEVSRAEAHHALLKSAQDAELLVVGSRGYSGVASLFLGSVAQRVASHATCPVVVVPPTSQEAAARRGRVVVGVDGSEHAAAALRFALVEAERLRAELVAVYAWQAPDAPVDPFTVLQADVAVDREQQVARAREWLLRTVDEARTPLTQRVPVRVETPEKHPAAALLDEGADADLIVVGSRGRGGFTGLLLGSVSQQVLNHAVVPVAVVRVSSAG